MSNPRRDVILIPEGYGSREAASFLAQLDELTAWMIKDLESVEPGELSWQPAPGQNTIGMLLAHIAIVEVFWTQVGVRGDNAHDTRPVIGLAMDDDGMPMPAGAAPPTGLDGKGLPYYLELMARARAYAKSAAMPLGDSDLDAMRSRTRRDGERQEYNVRWVLYHMLEHLAGHYGQILLLRHQYRDLKAQVGAKS